MDDIPTFIQTIAVGGGVALVVIMAARPSSLRRIAAWRIGGFHPFSPNWITAWSTVITLLALVPYSVGKPTLAVGLGVFGGLLDRIDGRSAAACGKTLDAPSLWQRAYRLRHGDYRLVAGGRTAQKTRFFRRVPDTRFGRWWFEMNFAGGTDLGKVWDPFQDKVRIFSVTAFFVWYGQVPLWPVLVQLVPEILGTLLRRPFDLLKAYHHPDPKATFVGKWKTLAQWGVVVAAILLDQGWLDPAMLDMPDGRFLLGNLTNFATLFAIASLLSRLRFVRQNRALGNAIETLDRGMSHD
ncbi:hypothetical protein EPO34_02285 [Patescibacteria group bacterium]|nr:MAG: hypothetical protein EPO34_02285 [Patescibacteria group bacterium]